MQKPRIGGPPAATFLCKFCLSQSPIYRVPPLGVVQMLRPMSDPRHRVLQEFLISKRIKAGLRQVDLARKLRRKQSYISHVETGQKVVSVVELLHWADAIGFDPGLAIRHLQRNGNNNKRQPIKP